MQLSVFSEIGRLREVLVHAPGPEVDNMPPALMKQLLFDDIIYGPRAREEHKRFRSVLEALGVKVYDVQNLLRETLEKEKDEIPSFVKEIELLEDLDPTTVAELETMAPDALSLALVQGLPARSEDMAPDYLFRFSPVPNLLFSRDAQIVMGDGVVISAMSRRARQREPLLSRFVFQNHPRLAASKIYADFLFRRPGPTWHQSVTPTLEGGDVMVFKEGVVLVGVSERTMEPAVDVLAEKLRPLDAFHTLIMVSMPRKRSAMHLDTIFTRISEDECLVYGPMILPGGPEPLSVISIDLRQSDDWGRRRPSLLDALKRVGIDLKPIYCGGRDDYIQQAREQWTDGANSFAVSPGVVMLYARNQATALELARNGYEIVSVADMDFSEEGRCLFSFARDKRYIILLSGEELSRARGGPRCMAMPFARDAV